MGLGSRRASCALEAPASLLMSALSITASTSRGLDVPSKWVYQDGPKLYATVLETVNNIEHGKVVQTVAAEVLCCATRLLQRQASFSTV